MKGSLLLLGGLAFGVCLLALTAQRPAHALVSGVLSPSAQGLDSNWTPVNAADEVSSVNQTSCSGSDGNWIVGGNPYKSSFQLPLSSLPSGALVTSVDLTLCYGDDNASADGFETIIPFVRMAGGEYKGSALHSPGNMTPLSNTQTINIPSSGVLEVGVQDTGFLAQSRLRVYAIWAVIHYSPPPAVSVSTTISGGTSPYQLGELFDWVIDVTVSPPGIAAIALTGVFDPTVVTDFTTSTTQGSCTVGLGNFSCGFATSVQVRAHMGVRVSPACETVLRVHVSALGTVSGSIPVDAETPLNVDAGCVPPILTATPSPSATPVPPTGTATGTSTSGASSPTATGTSALPTSTPTGTGGGTTVTATPTATGTSIPSGPRPYKLRTLQLARDGTD